VSLLTAVAPALPLHAAGKYVAGAYVVFVAVILVYVAIMAIRAQHIERDLEQLTRDVEEIRARERDDEDAARRHPESVL
jgi:hypothetical protein